MDDIPWGVIAIVFITFVSWVYNRIQEVAADRRQRQFQKIKRAYEKQEARQAPVQAPPPPSRTPPPLRREEPAPGSSRPVVSLPRKKSKPSVQVQRKKRVAGIRKLLKGQDSIRQALIASEILHKPKAFDD